MLIELIHTLLCVSKEDHGQIYKIDRILTPFKYGIRHSRSNSLKVVDRTGRIPCRIQNPP